MKSAWRTGDGARSVARRTQMREIKASTKAARMVKKNGSIFGNLAKEKGIFTSRAGATVERIEQKERMK